MRTLTAQETGAVAGGTLCSTRLSFSFSACLSLLFSKCYTPKTSCEPVKTPSTGGCNGGSTGGDTTTPLPIE